MMFVGVLTNAVFAMLIIAGGNEVRRPMVDDLVFFGMNAGLLGFVVSLVAEQTWLERIATPVIGAAHPARALRAHPSSAQRRPGRAAPRIAIAPAIT